MMLMCEECSMWMPTSRNILKILFLSVGFSCEEPVENFYYSAKFQDTCVHCVADEVAPWSDLESHYPQCDGRSDKPKKEKND